MTIAPGAENREQVVATIKRVIQRTQEARLTPAQAQWCQTMMDYLLDRQVDRAYVIAREIETWLDTNE